MCAKLNFGNTYQIILVSKKEAEVLKKVCHTTGLSNGLPLEKYTLRYKSGQINWEKWDGVKELGEKKMVSESLKSGTSRGS